MSTLKRLANRLPHRWQAELRRIHFGRQIAQDRFDTSEAEFGLLPQLLQSGDWAIDVGANAERFAHGNVSLFNAAVSDQLQVLGMRQLIDRSRPVLIIETGVGRTDQRHETSGLCRRTLHRFVQRRVPAAVSSWKG